MTIYAGMVTLYVPDDDFLYTFNIDSDVTICPKYGVEHLVQNWG